MTDLFEGRTVITREPAYLTEAFGKKLPKPRLVSGVNECLLSDETTIFECSGGDFASVDVNRVIRHRSKHADSSRKYPPAILDKVMKYRELERAKGVRGWAERVAVRLNKEKVRRPDGSRWFASTVSSLAQAHVADYEAAEQETLKDAAIGEAITRPPAPLKAVENMVNNVAGIAATTALVIHPETPELLKGVAMVAKTITAESAAHQIKVLADWLATAVKPCPHDDYEELKAKAAMLDQMRTFMGEGK